MKNNNLIKRIIVGEGFDPVAMIDFVCDFIHSNDKEFLDKSFLKWRMRDFFIEVVVEGAEEYQKRPKFTKAMKKAILSTFDDELYPMIEGKLDIAINFISCQPYENDLETTYVDYRFNCFEAYGDLFSEFWNWGDENEVVQPEAN